LSARMISSLSISLNLFSSDSIALPFLNRDLLRQLKSLFLQIAQCHCTNARKNNAGSQITRFILISPLEIAPLCSI
jgi:hypothetical protein